MKIGLLHFRTKERTKTNQKAVFNLERKIKQRKGVMTAELMGSMGAVLLPSQVGSPQAESPQIPHHCLGKSDILQWMSRCG